jgi:acetaldehyde dehydrogenase (acetylating)
MKHKLISIILATGSNPMVRSAYSSGKPAYGVGSGNVPAYIEKSANIKKAVADIVSGKIFDYGVLCSTEASVVVDSTVKTQVVEEFKRKNCYFVEGEEKERLSRTMFDQRGAINPAMVGKSASYIAQAAGIQVPANTAVLIAELTGVGREYPLSREKLSPVLSMFTVNDWREGCERSIELLEFGGIGHTLVIHSMDEDIIMKFALEKPAFRILVNTQSALGAVGYTNELLPSMTLGPGTFGGSIISENVSAKHMFNVKRLAFETRPINPVEGAPKAAPAAAKIAAATKPAAKPLSTPPAVKKIEQAALPTTSWMTEIEDRIRSKAGNIPAPAAAASPAKESPASASKDGSLGTGISETEVERIMKEFGKR